MYKVFYGRVSSDLASQNSSYLRQKEIGESLGCEVILIEKESGRSSDRTQYQQLLKLIQGRKVSAIYATRSDRIFRDYQESNYFYALCQKYGVAWHFTEEPEISSDSPYGELLRRERAFMAESESRKLGERQKAAYRHAQNQGKVVFRKAPLGYRFEDGKAVVAHRAIAVELSESQIMGKIVEFYLETKSLKQSIKHWKRWLKQQTPIDSARINRLLQLTTSGLKSWLINPIIRGHTPYNKYRREMYGDRLNKVKYISNPPSEWQVLRNTHDALISEETYQEVEKILQINSEKGRAIAESRRNGLPISLGRILRCVRCKHTFYSVTTTDAGKKYRYYYCTGRKDYNCDCKGISEKSLQTVLIEEIIKESEKLIEAVERELQPQKTTESLEILRLKKEIKEARDKYSQLGLDAFLSLAESLENAMLELNHQTDLSFYSIPIEDLEQFKLLPFWESLTVDELHEVLIEVVGTVWLENGRVTQIDFDF